MRLRKLPSLPAQCWSFVELHFGRGFECSKVAIPEAVEVGAHHFHTVWIDAINAKRSLFAQRYEPGIEQHFQMLRYRWSSNRQPLGQLPNRHRFFGEPLEDEPPRGVAQRVEGFRMVSHG